MKKVVWTLSVVAALTLLAGCQQPAVVAPTPAPAATSSTEPSAAPAAPQMYTATIDQINHSGVKGEATVTVSGSMLTVVVSASGLVPGQPHAAHIHGLGSGQSSTCPQAPNGTGLLTLEPAAEKFYGPVLAPLTPFPTASSAGDVSFTSQVDVSTSAVASIPVMPLAGRAIVLHGLMMKGKYNPGVPVGCGELTAIPGQ